MDNTNSNLGINKHMPIEKHETAPLAYVKSELPESKVAIPGEEAVNMAKEWVEDNQK